MRPKHGSLACVAAFLLIVLGGQAVAQTTPRPDWKERFRMHDRNADGRIDREEFQQWMVEVFYFRDKDRKGYLVMEDLRDLMAPETLKVLNRKGDGKLTLPEFLNAAFLDFEAVDVNRNGAIRIEEVEVYIRRPGR